MQSSIEGYLHLLACEHFLSASSNSSSCFFCYNGQPLQIPACLYQATWIDAGSMWNFARMATDATKRKHYCKCKHFPTLSLTWLSLAWPQCKPAFRLQCFFCFMLPRTCWVGAPKLSLSPGAGNLRYAIA